MQIVCGWRWNGSTDFLSSQTFVRFPFTDLFSTRALVVKDATYDPAVPLSLKMGDFNLGEHSF